jgi:general secretion pathway protein G
MGSGDGHISRGDGTRTRKKGTEYHVVMEHGPEKKGRSLREGDRVGEKEGRSLICWGARAKSGSVPLFRCAGYTLIELIIVMAIISILLATAVPMYQKSLTRTKESLLKNNLFTLRTVIDEYTFDKQKAPQTLQDLVDQGYLRGVPMDPITGNNQSWRVIMEDAISSVDQTQPGIYDVRSGSDLKSLEGNAYSEW